MALEEQGEIVEAARIHRETLEVQRRVLGAEHPDTLTSANNLAIVLEEQGELVEAARINRETLEVRRRVLGAEHPQALASGTNLARVLEKQGELAEGRGMPGFAASPWRGTAFLAIGLLAVAVRYAWSPFAWESFPSGNL